MPEALEIVAVPAFDDNYLWLVHDAASGETVVIDPGDSAPVLAEADRPLLDLTAYAFAGGATGVHAPSGPTTGS